VRIEVRLFANLADYLPAGGRAGTAVVEVPGGATVGDLVRRLAIPDGLPRLALVNGRDAGPEHPLAPGDVVSLLPPLAGG
jgi:molybdopterin converting factor small subunit